MHDTALSPHVHIHRVTDGQSLVSNIYCERPFCSADASRFLFARQCNAGGPLDRSDWEYVLCEFGTWKETVVGRGELGVSISYNDDFYYHRPGNAGQRELVRIDLATGDSSTLWSSPPAGLRIGHPTASHDGKRVAFHAALSYQPQNFGIIVIDLEKGTQTTICQSPWLSNAHLQFCPTDANILLAQVNRGCVFSPEGQSIRRVGDEGATLWLVNATTGQIQELEIGQPHTPPITGHQTWLGRTGSIVLTVLGRAGYTPVPGEGNVLILEPGKPARQLGTGVALNHIGSTHCGRYIHGDSIEHDRIMLISPRTGKVSLIHEDLTQPNESPFGQMSHPHAYLTPDYKWMVFNSDRTGRPAVHVASIPPSLLPD